MEKTNDVQKKDFEGLLETLDNLKADANKFYDKKNKAAGTRLRKGLMKLKRDTDLVRKKVLDVTKAPSN